MKNILILLALVLTASCGSAQQWNTKDKKAIKYIKRAIEEANNPGITEWGRPDYSNAITWIDKAIDRDENFVDAYGMKGDLYMQMGNKMGAIEAYQKIVEIPTYTTGTGFVYFDLAALEVGEGMYEDALKHASKYVTFKNIPPEQKSEAEWIVKICNFAIEAKKNPVPFEPLNVGTGVNTYDYEYFPTLTVDEKQLLFTRRVTSNGGTSAQEDFFISTNREGMWDTGVPMPKNINTPYNEGAPTFAPDGKTLIFVGCINDKGSYGPGRRGFGSCDLFITQKQGTKWLDPINLPGNVNTKHWETQPSLSSDGRSLYFIRGILRQQGGKNQRTGDIYVSRLQDDGTWGMPEKLPDNINTPYSESSVLIHPDGKTLYFSSNGHVGMGGDDLFMSELQPDGSWSDPKNLGYPINTHHNENSLLVFANGELAIFGSSRPGGMGGLDLYEFKLPKEVQPTKTTYMTGTVYDQNTEKRLQAKFYLVDLETGEEVVRAQSDPVDGSFLVSLPINKRYALFVQKDGYHPYTVNFDLVVPENSEEPYHRDVPLQPLEGGGENILANVLFDLDRATLRKESFVELNRFADFLKRHPDMKIELQGHTDAQGDDEHNLDLSKRRAKAVYDYLVKQGVEADRMKHKGFGETKPSSYTDKTTGKEVVRTEEWINALPTEKERKSAHQQNRRTVYVVLSN